jgi:hypothetical protein
MFVASSVLSKLNCLFKETTTLEVILKSLFTVFIKLVCTVLTEVNILIRTLIRVAKDVTVFKSRFKTNLVIKTNVLETVLIVLLILFSKLTVLMLKVFNILLTFFNKLAVILLVIFNIVLTCFDIELVVVVSTVKVFVYKVELKDASDANGVSANALNPNITHPQRQRSL